MMTGTGSVADSFARLEEHRAWFLQQLEKAGTGLEPLARDEWSLLQVIEHVVIVERGVLIALMRGGPELPKRTPVNNLKRKMVWSIMRLAVKVPVPVPEVNPSPEPDREKLLAEWAKIRTKMAKAIESESYQPLAHVFSHPVAGALSADESLEFLLNHLTYHRIRTQKLLRA